MKYFSAHKDEEHAKDSYGALQGYEACREEKRKGRIIKKVFSGDVKKSFPLVKRERIESIDIQNADVIVSRGRGLKSREDFRMIEKLASLLGGVVGSSRPLVDDGWISKDHRVGFSGNTVKPGIYVAVGISGSPQHLAGMRNSEMIIAVNSDPSAPTFRYADCGIVGLWVISVRLCQS